MNDVLGIEDAGDLPRAMRERCVQGSRLVLRPAGVDDHPDELRVAFRDALRDGAGPVVVRPDDHEHLEIRMIARDQSRERGFEHRLLVARGDDQRERVRRIEIDRPHAALRKGNPAYARRPSSRPASSRRSFRGGARSRCRSGREASRSGSTAFGGCRRRQQQETHEDRRRDPWRCEAAEPPLGSPSAAMTVDRAEPPARTSRPRSARLAPLFSPSRGSGAARRHLPRANRRV